VNERARALWASARLHVWPERYVLASVPVARASEAIASLHRAGEAFAAFVRERDECSLSVPEALRPAVEPLAERIAGPYRVITFDLSLDLDVIGFLSPAAERLANAGVSIVPQCGFRTDHLLVWDRDLEVAIRTLEALIRESGVRQPLAGQGHSG
jgi:hypothetical protein